MALTRFKLVFFCPRKNTKEILKHLFAKFPTTFGKIGNYEQCAFVSPGVGQFKPGPSAKPAIGQRGVLVYVEEDRVEVRIDDNGHHAEISAAIKELKTVHPYEEVAYDVYRLENF